jgi:hypothetical protein
MNTRLLGKCVTLSTFLAESTWACLLKEVQAKEKELTPINILLYIYIYIKKIDRLPLF